MKTAEQEIMQLIDTAMAHLTHARVMIRPSIGGAQPNQEVLRRHFGEAQKAVGAANTKHKFMELGR
jgi:hypothetical protein